MSDATRTGLYDLFLSHSHQDETAVRALKAQLSAWPVQGRPIEVYASFEDGLLQQPGPMTSERCARLVAVMRRARALVYAYSSASGGQSGWMPWELGLGHGVIGRILLWPLDAGAEAAAAQREYLTLYESVPHGPAARRARVEALVAEARARPLVAALVERAEDAGYHLVQHTLAHPDVFGGLQVTRDAAQLSQASSQGAAQASTELSGTTRSAPATKLWRNWPFPG